MPFERPLQTYDFNEAGQVHTYIRYLGYLPISEQRYWKAFNEPPKGTISLDPSRLTLRGAGTSSPTTWMR
jgi:hypothetical protein